MFGWFKALSIIKKVAVVGGSVIAISGVSGAVANPPKTPTATPPDPGVTHVQSDKIEVKEIVETEPIPFTSTTQNDPTLASGSTKISTAGVSGSKTVTYKVTYTNDVETSREKVSETVTLQPVTQVTRIGTYVAPAPPTCPNGTYVNTYGNTVCSPYSAPSVPVGATARCVDGTYSFSQSRSGTCSHHGGVATWL